METYVSYRQTTSRNYQSKTHEVGFKFNMSADDPTELVKARQLCTALVRHALGEKTGHTRRQLDALAKHFHGCTFKELSTGVAEGDEEV